MGEAGDGEGVAQGTGLNLRSREAASRRMATDSWFETREDALLTMRDRERMAARSIFALAERREPR
jgi:hypothetical protein